jgi:hypothetical protein
MMRRLLLTVLGVTLASVVASNQTNGLRFKQERDGAPVVTLNESERLTLDDPFFNLVLREHADAATIKDVEQRLQPDPAQRPVFVVHELIASPAAQGLRRAVIAFDGETGNEKLKGNVMLSVTFSPQSMAEEQDIEALAWDEHRGRYNYYKLDMVGSPGRRTWKFRGSSADADLLRPEERGGTCLACHINGAPVMKELFLPWNNWHSVSSMADYLVSGAGGTPWAVAQSERFRASLQQAERFEVDFIIPSVRRFNVARINALLKRRPDTGDRFVEPDGRLTMVQGKRLLRPLFETTEVNLISSRDKSSLHPVGPQSVLLPDQRIRIPDGFFLNTHLIAGGGPAGYNGLKIPGATKFRAPVPTHFATLSRGENKSLIESLNVVVSGTRGDANFAWLVPEPSHVDNDLVDQLLQQGVVTPHFVAAALAVDLESPVFSSRRSELLRLMPDQFRFVPLPAGTDPTSRPRDAANDELTQLVLKAIAAASPPAGSPAAEFRALLASADAVAVLRERVDKYAQRVESQLKGTPAQRQQELRRLYDSLLAARRGMLGHPVLSNLDETGGRLLLPLPATP